MGNGDERYVFEALYSEDHRDPLLSVAQDVKGILPEAQPLFVQSGEGSRGVSDRRQSHSRTKRQNPLRLGRSRPMKPYRIG